MANRPEKSTARQNPRTSANRTRYGHRTGRETVIGMKRIAVRRRALPCAPPLPLAVFARRDFPVEFRRFVLGHGERLPLPGTKVFGQHNNLPDVVGIMSHLPVDGLHHRVFLAADGHRASDIGLAQRTQRAPYAIPAVLPEPHHLRARGRRLDELAVPLAVRLLAIGGQKIRPSRPHVPRHVFDNLRDGIHLAVERQTELFIRDLRHGVFAQFLVIAKQRERIFQVRCCELECHAPIIPASPRSLPPPLATIKLPFTCLTNLSRNWRRVPLRASLSPIRRRLSKRCAWTLWAAKARSPRSARAWANSPPMSANASACSSTMPSSESKPHTMPGSSSSRRTPCARASMPSGWISPCLHPVRAAATCTPSHASSANSRTSSYRSDSPCW